MASSNPAAGRTASTSIRKAASTSIATAKAADRTTRRSTTTFRNRPFASWPDSTRRSNSKTQAVHESATIALEALLEGPIRQRCLPASLDRPVPEVEIKKASYPDYDYRTEGKVKDYWNMYTLNDGLAGTVSETLLAAEAVYKDSRYRAALEKLGDFLILAQMPDPQPVWAQQYSRDMHPIWARRFEPAAITGGESQDVIETLMKIYRTTGDKKYLGTDPSRPGLPEEIAAARRPPRPLLRNENQSPALHEPPQRRILADV